MADHDEKEHENQAVVDLGFAEECEPTFLTSPNFPSKIGGHPAWLSFDELPSPQTLQCETCQLPMRFLLQAYTGGNFEPEYCYHRAVFVFACTKPTCQREGRQGSFKVLRCQLRRNNPWYPSEPPSDDEPASFLDDAPIPPLCVICGKNGPLRCGKCRQVPYCSKAHQVRHWKRGHKESCGTDCAQDVRKEALDVFPEFELVVEGEPDQEDRSAAPSSDRDQMQEFQRLVREQGLDTSGDASLEGLEQELDRVLDPVLGRFRERVNRAPEQVFRYDMGGQSLWIGDRVPASDDIPACPHCHGPRQFEFQVLPQIANFIETDANVATAMDLGTLAVYTCKQSCDIGSKYVEEVFWHNKVNEGQPRLLFQDDGDDEIDADRNRRSGSSNDGGSKARDSKAKATAS